MKQRIVHASSIHLYKTLTKVRYTTVEPNASVGITREMNYVQQETQQKKRAAFTSWLRGLEVLDHNQAPHPGNI